MNQPNSANGVEATTRNLSWYETAEVWIEAGHESTRAAEWRVSFGEALPNGHQDFWVPFSAPNGIALGWMRFSYITTARMKSLFAATEWRSANEPAPPEQDQLPLPLGPELAGFLPRR